MEGTATPDKRHDSGYRDVDFLAGTLKLTMLDGDNLKKDFDVSSELVVKGKSMT